MTVSAATAPAVDGQAYPPAGRAWGVVAVLVLAYTFSYIDRTLLTLLVQPVRAALRISDVQIGLLQGFAFAIFYSVLGLPIGWLADRRARRGVIAAGVATWSVMTMLCGAARSFGELFAARVGVGVGEAALSPAAFSLLADMFPPRALPRALGVYSAAIYLGSGLALIGGGVLIGMVPTFELDGWGEVAPWRALFVIVGAPGLLIAVLVATIREPSRRGRGSGGASFADGARHVWRSRSAYLLLIGGFAVESLIWNGTQAWLPTMFIRAHGWTAREAGLVIGSGLLICGTGGVTLGGVLAGRMRRRDPCAAIKIGIASASAMAAAGATACLAPSGALAAAGAWLFILGGSLPYGAAAAALQDITPNRLRGQVSALYLLLLNLAGIGCGPVLVALMSEHVTGGDASLPVALTVMTLCAAPVAAILLVLAMRPFRRALALCS